MGAFSPEPVMNTDVGYFIIVVLCVFMASPLDFFVCVPHETSGEWKPLLHAKHLSKIGQS